MAGQTHNSALRLYEAQFNDKEFTSTNNLSRALQSQSEWLAPFVTHAYGSSRNFGSINFPLSFVTEGMGNVKRISSSDLSYKIAVIGRPKKTSTIAGTSVSYSSTDTPGRGRSRFYVVFEDRWFFRSLSVYSPSRIECRVMKDPEQVQGGWRYELQMMNPDPNAYMPISDLAPGSVWGRTVAKVGKERSRGVEHRSYSHFATQNQITVTRDTYNLAGNIKNKVMVLEIKADGNTYKYWTQWELFLKHLEYKEKCESDLWYSEYNKDAEGIIHMTDDETGEVVPSGAGMLQQIPNEDSYSILTEDKLKGLIREVFFNASDADKVMVEVYTGTGGMEEADRAMKTAAAGFTLVDSKVIKGDPSSGLQYGAYYNVYRHVDGHMVTFKKLPLMDNGVMADISPKHPITGLPLESYNMYFVDNSTYDGLRNIQYVSEAGREEIQKVVAGVNKLPDGYGDPLYVSSDIDASSIEWMKTHGIAVTHPTNCFKLLCNFN